MATASPKVSFSLAQNVARLFDPVHIWTQNGLNFALHPLGEDLEKTMQPAVKTLPEAVQREHKAHTRHIKKVQ